MNQVSQHILSIYHYNVLIRDTLEYALIRDTYNQTAFEQRKKGLKMALTEKSPIRNFIDNNGETGKTIETKLNDFIDTVYGDDSTILKMAPDGLRVDHAQHIQLFDFIVGLHETFSDVTRVYSNFAKEKNEYEAEIDTVIHDDERLYRSIVFMTVMPEISKTFLEFNKAMRESKGQPSPQVNYIVGDLKKLVGFLSFQKAHNTIKDEDFNVMMDDCFRVIDYIEGKRELPWHALAEEEKATYKGPISGTGQRKATFPEVFKDNQDVINKQVAISEAAWKKSYQPIITALMEQQKINAELAKANGGAEPSNPKGNA